MNRNIDEGYNFTSNTTPRTDGKNGKTSDQSLLKPKFRGVQTELSIRIKDEEKVQCIFQDILPFYCLFT